MTPSDVLAGLALASGEATLAAGAMLLLLLGAFVGDRATGLVSSFAVLVLAAAGGAIVLVSPAEGGAFGGVFVQDAMTRVVKLVILTAAAVTLLMSHGFLRSERLERAEFPVIMVLATLGMLIMVSAQDLIVLYVGLELSSLSLYVLAAFNRDSGRASEAGVKYFVLGALSSGLLLYGLSLVYGFSGGELGYDAIAAAASPENVGLIFGLVFVICGLAFKISAAPFHMWTPDVYEGAPTPATAFFAGAPKLAAMVLLARVLSEPFGGMADAWVQVIAAIAALSIVVGSIGALVQTNIKRLMAYSSIANMGFALVALSAGGQAGVSGALVYMMIYVITTTGLFACILAMRRRDGMVERIEDLAGLSRTHPLLALAATGLLFSVAGIPPLAGFFAKFYAFIPAAAAGHWWLVILAVLGSVVAAYYYLRIIKVMWFEEAKQPLAPGSVMLVGVASAAALTVFPVLVLPFAAVPARSWIEAAAAALF